MRPANVKNTPETEPIAYPVWGSAVKNGKNRIAAHTVAWKKMIMYDGDTRMRQDKPNELAFHMQVVVGAGWRKYKISPQAPEPHYR